MITLLRSAPDSSAELRSAQNGLTQTHSLKSGRKDGHEAQARVMIRHNQTHMQKYYLIRG